MENAENKMFLIYCPCCKAKVAAVESGRAERDISETTLDRERLVVGQCPQCGTLLAGETHNLDIDCAADADPWSEIVRIYPAPLKDLQGYQIPATIQSSIQEAEKCLQIGANIAACAMLGRALEAVCRDRLGKDVMLKKGITEMKVRKIIDDRLYDWSKEIHTLRNGTAHPDRKISVISQLDAEDLHSFVYAIVEYIYILTARYDDFKERREKREKNRIPACNPADPKTERGETRL